MSIAPVDVDQLTLDDLESLILLNNQISEQVRQEYLRLIDKLRAQLKTRKEVNTWQSNP